MPNLAIFLKEKNFFIGSQQGTQDLIHCPEKFPELSLVESRITLLMSKGLMSQLNYRVFCCNTSLLMGEVSLVNLELDTDFQGFLQALAP